MKEVEELIVYLRQKGLSYKLIISYLEKNGYGEFTKKQVREALEEYAKETGDEFILKQKMIPFDKKTVSMFKQLGFTNGEIADHYNGIGNSHKKKVISKMGESEKNKSGDEAKIYKITRLEIVSLYESGKSKTEIYDMCLEKNIKCSYEEINKAIGEHHDRVRENAFLQGNEEFISKSKILYLRQKGMSEKSIENFYRMQGFSITEANIKFILENICNGNVAENMVNGLILKNGILQGKTVDEIDIEYKDETLKKKLEERLEKFKGIATFFYNKGNEFYPNEKLVGLFKTMGSESVIVHGTDKIRKSIPTKICDNGNIILITNRVLNENEFLQVFYFSRLIDKNLVGLAEYDMNTYKKNRQDLDEKLDITVSRLGLLEQNIFKKDLSQKKEDQSK